MVTSITIQVGAVIVNRATKDVLGVGHNRMPIGCEEQLPWSDDDKQLLKSKYPYGNAYTN